MTASPFSHASSTPSDPHGPPTRQTLMSFKNLPPKTAHLPVLLKLIFVVHRELVLNDPLHKQLA